MVRQHEYGEHETTASPGHTVISSVTSPVLVSTAPHEKVFFLHKVPPTWFLFHEVPPTCSVSPGKKLPSTYIALPRGTAQRNDVTPGENISISEVFHSPQLRLVWNEQCARCCCLLFVVGGGGGLSFNRFINSNHTCYVYNPRFSCRCKTSNMAQEDSTG